MQLHATVAAACLLLLSLSGCGDAPGAPKPESEVLRPEDQLNFGFLYKQNCAACHGATGQNGAAIDLANPEYQALVDDESLKKWISNGMPGTQMPAWALSDGGPLTDRQIDVIIRGMRYSWRQSDVFGGLTPPAYLQTGMGNAILGKQGYEGHCLSCHSASRQQVTSPDYLVLISDQALRSIIIAGRPDIHHPDWRNDSPGTPLSAEDVTDIVAYLASLRTPTPGQPYPQHQ